MAMRTTRLACFLAFLTLVGSAQQPQPPGPGKNLNNPGPFTPAEERATFKLPAGFRIDLAACEPQVVDPVALAFDERGRLFVAEMYGYPNDGVGTGDINNGKVKCLEDRDGDGKFETATVFAEGLRFPVVVKPNIGGSGAGIVRFDTAEALAHAVAQGAVHLGIDETALVQEFIPAEEGRVVRVEVLDGRYLYAIRIYTPGTSFNLCPADVCQGVDGAAQVFPSGGCPLRLAEDFREGPPLRAEVVLAAGQLPEDDPQHVGRHQRPEALPGVGQRR